MHLRISRVRRGAKTYEYAQLVESYRRGTDSMPMHRVVASLGQLSKREIVNLRTALQASRQGQGVVVAKAAARSHSPVKPRQNLRYLDLAVLLELWRQWGLDELLATVLPVGEAQVEPAAVIAALAIHRCVDPGSKLHAERWFPTTALPELMGVSSAQFNNTRLHRVLDDLDQAGPELMRLLPRRYQEREGAFATLFLDISDAEFVGQGPEAAQRARTKDDVIRRKIGLLLLCNQHGYPLRWAVLPGRQAEPEAMLELIASIRHLDWVAHTPLIADRALGKTQYIGRLLDSGVAFLTALTRPEFPSYTTAIPYQALADLAVRPDSHGQAAREAARRVAQAGWEPVSDNLWVHDLGVVEPTSPPTDATRAQSPTHEDHTVRALRLARAIEQAVQTGQAPSQAAAARELGLSRGLAKKYHPLARLPEAIQADLLEGRAPGLSLANLLQLVRMEETTHQVRAFKELAELAASRPHRPLHQSTPPPAPSDPPPRPLRVRLVAYFNPDLFVEQRLRATRRLRDIQVYVEQLNAKLASPHSKRTQTSVAAAIDRKLRGYNLVTAFDIHIEQLGSRWQVRLELDPQNWAARRRYDGFSLLVAHPDLTQPAAELCRLYRAKDTVEKDFQVINGQIRLRPIWHHTDAKVRAHVTICMLALLLERTLRQRLGESFTANAALEHLATGYLNRYDAPEDQSAYTITHLDSDQEAILRKLALLHLGDDMSLMEAISPR